VDRLSDAELDQLRQTQEQWMFEVCVIRAWLIQQAKVKCERARGCVLADCVSCNGCGAWRSALQRVVGSKYW
jgi:hypothetical protein